MSRAIPRRVVIQLGFCQFICWGAAYYLPGGLAASMASGLGWAETRIFGGFSLALAVMALASPIAGRLIGRGHGRQLMALGSFLAAAALCGMASSTSWPLHLFCWAVLGIAMRLNLYDAAFALLARLGGVGARRAMAEITLPAGLSSSVFWPLTRFLDGVIGWQASVLVLAALLALTVPLYLALPRPAPALAQETAARRVVTGSDAPDESRERRAAPLYALSMALTSVQMTGFAAHTITLLAGFGLAAGTAVAIASLRGVGQTTARFCEVMLGRRLHPTHLHLGATLLMLLAFLPGPSGGITAAISFALGFGAASGLLSITRGTLPLVLFEPGDYGRRVGVLLIPGLLLPAGAPWLFGLTIERAGTDFTYWACAACALAQVLVALALVHVAPARRLLPV
ncbi:MFS transporter [Radicibacter daui]|uniref:MFS transporter n=1 Tax=Radicibacter daui TaxID=3064829 RepID=UPI004046A1C8